MEHALVEGHDVAAEAAVGFVAADDALLRPRSRTRMMRPSGALGGHALDANHHAVAVQGLLQVDGGDVDVAFARAGRARRLVRNHEPEAARVAGEPSHDQVHAVGQADARAADLDDLAVLDQAAQHGLELVAPVGLETEAAHDVAHGDGLAVAGEEREHGRGEIARGAGGGLVTGGHSRLHDGAC